MRKQKMSDLVKLRVTAEQRRAVRRAVAELRRTLRPITREWHRLNDLMETHGGDATGVEQEWEGRLIHLMVKLDNLYDLVQQVARENDPEGSGAPG